VVKAVVAVKVVAVDPEEKVVAVAPAVMVVVVREIQMRIMMSTTKIWKMLQAAISQNLGLTKVRLIRQERTQIMTKLVLRKLYLS